jgi:hypothetical protein
MAKSTDLALTFSRWSAILSLAGDRPHSACLMTHPHFLLGLCLGAALSVSAFLYGTSPVAPAFTDQASIAQGHATGEFTGP